MMKYGCTNRTKILSLEEHHFPILYSWITDKDNIMLWSNIREFPEPDDYYRYLKLKMEFNFVSQFIIVKASTEKLVGTIFIHDQNFDDEYASISAYIIPEERKKTYSMEAYFLAFNYIFTSLPIRKLYMDVFSYNLESIKLIEKVGFKMEGRFVNHRKVEDGYFDLLRFSFFKNDWLEMKNSNMHLLKEYYL